MSTSTLFIPSPDPVKLLDADLQSVRTGLKTDHRQLVIGYQEALRLILSAEAGGDFSTHINEELAAIVSHWLQSPEDAPILLGAEYGKKWRSVLREYCVLQNHNPASGAPKKNKKQAPFRIDFSGLPFPPIEKPRFTFIDLFAGIGGFRIALQRLGGKCLFSSEWDKHAKETYFQNYGEVPFGDITKFTNTERVDGLEPNHIPRHDILCGGFPCQPFSQAGKQLGFEDARGTLFFDILKIIQRVQPRVVFLENVKRLKTHDKGKTFSVICNSLKELGYTVYAKILRAYDFGVPQNRERIFIVAFSEPLQFSFPRAQRYQLYRNVGDALEFNPDTRFTISDKMWIGHQKRLEKHRNKGNGFGYSLFSHTDEYVNTISARYWKDGSEVLISQQGQNPRTLTPRECARFQGYPDMFIVHPSNRYAYQQFGNSVAVPVVEAIAREIWNSLVHDLSVQTSLESQSSIVN